MQTSSKVMDEDKTIKPTTTREKRLMRQEEIDEASYFAKINFLDARRQIKRDEQRMQNQHIKGTI